MKILITNDDGINAIGIRLLANWAKDLGEVTVVAPEVEQSGMSHAIDFTRPIRIRQVPFPYGITAYSMASTPADCVRFGVMGLKERFDLVLSGINRGVNVGADIVYSGTVGAIFEAARLGTRGIAFSAFPSGQEEASLELPRVYDWIVAHRLLEETPILNVNIPDAPTEIRLTYQGSPYFSDEFVKLEENLYIQQGGQVPDVCPEDIYRDTVAIHQRVTSVTPLLPTRTDMAVFERWRDRQSSNR